MVTVRSKPSNAIFRAIADPTRREILSLLRGGRYTVGEIAANFRISRPAVSKHLRLLRAARLVVTRQQGTARSCALNAKPLRAVNAWLQDYEAFWGDSMRGLKMYVEEAERRKEKHS
jgi:DNA-binding transcriptional ArsR family regulator